MTSRFALVIANTEYQDASFAKLTAPGKDAEEFAQVLRKLAAFDDVQVLLNEGEGKTRRSIARFFAERKRDDLLLLYFSGHGVRNEQGQLFLAANDTEIGILEASGIPAEFVTNSMNNSRSQRQLLILDCCNSGAFAYGSKSTSVVGQSMGIATAFEGSGFGRVVLTATDATQYAWEGDKVIGDTQKSVFTHFLIEGLKGEADRDGDGRIDIDELYDYAYEQVVSRTPKQTPGKWSYKQQGDIVLRENLKPREVKAVPLPSELHEMLSHPSSSVRRAGIQDLISLLDGKHPGLARAAQEKLREIAENDDSLTLRRTASETLNARGLIPELPVPVAIPKEEYKEEKQIEKPRSPSLPAPLPVGEERRGEVQPRKLPEQKKVALKFNPRLIAGIIGGLVLITLCIWGSVSLLNSLPFTNPEPTRTSQPVTTQISQFEITNTPSPTETSIPPSPTLGIGSMMIGKDGMTLMYVPAGEFTMGSTAKDAVAYCPQSRQDCKLEMFQDEEPVHIINLDAFWIDQTEVTNSIYAKCVEDGVCKQPSQINSATRDTYYGNSVFDNYPVINVSWDDANNYCSWAGRRLPTEAEWEKAARGTQGDVYPWGNGAPKSSVANYDNNVGDTSAVKRYEAGKSPYGLYDMAGNVWEWVSSLYKPYPYSATDGREDLNASGVRVFRGGAYDYIPAYIRSNIRFKDNPLASFGYLGFRCAMNATP